MKVPVVPPQKMNLNAIWNGIICIQKDICDIIVSSKHHFFQGREIQFFLGRNGDSHLKVKIMVGDCY